METSEDPVPFSTKCILVLVAVLATGVLVVYTTLVYQTGVESARVMALAEARRDARVELEAELRKACSPWFTDRRRGTVTVCRRPPALGGAR